MDQDTPTFAYIKKATPRAILNDWRLLETFDGDYVVVGDIHGDVEKVAKDGTRWQTSPVVKLDILNKTVMTLNSLYFLGKHRYAEK